MPVHETTACPIDHQPDVNQRDTEETAIDEMKSAAQAALDYPEYVPDIFDGLRQSLTQRYALMLEHNPAKAELKIARQVRAAYRAALGSLTFSTMVSEWLRYGNDIDKQIYMMWIHHIDYDYSTTFMNGTYNGAADRWMSTMVYAIECDALERIYCCKGTGNNILRNLERYERSVYGPLADAYNNSGVETVVKVRNKTLIIDNMHATRDNFTATFDVMLAGAVAIVRAEQELQSGQVLAGKLQDNILPMVAHSSMNRESFAKAVNPHLIRNEQQIFLPDGSDLEYVENVFTYRDGILIPNHPSLRDGPWDPQRNCGGNFLLRTPVDTVRNDVTEYFETIGHPELGPDEFGRTRATIELASLAIDVGRLTLFKRRDNPVNRRYALDGEGSEALHTV